eukprot:comp21400_c0_seq1/m.29469 comp21400_c0_seq1/g.29469  ORF comp21400_c0_seq1/g.29469 comp21400_c0_seq1/m.29469 type:complete len:481 (-) comp21400_c0_seq1:439-1881(-)
MVYAVVEQLANDIGAPAAGLALILGLVLGVPLAAVYQFVINRLPVFLRHVYIIAAGAFLLHFNYEHETLYVLASILGTWLIMAVMGPTVAAAGTSFVANMVYLLAAYRIYETEDYDINWTTAQCVMCLRMIAIAFDYADSRKVGKTDSKGKSIMTSDQIQNNFAELPGLLEMFSYSLFFPAVLVGPQITFRNYREFIADTNGGAANRPARSEYVVPAIVSLLKGIAFMGLYQVVNPMVPLSHYDSNEFLNETPVWGMIWFMFLRGFVFFWRYIACWLMAEAACILTGISYTGRDKDGSIKWGLRNCEPLQFHTSLNLATIIKSFNINTNNWAMRIIYKRCAFLGNKLYSQLATLMFLAIWHGFHGAYFYAFFIEFYEVFAENKGMEMTAGLQAYVYGPNCPPPLKWLAILATWLLRSFVLHNGVMAFELLDYTKSMAIMVKMNFIPHMVPTAIIILWAVWAALFKPKKPKAEKEAAKKTN